ncbi:MAG: hypothetical protein EBZ69_08660 [Alphaproteobacteria bacterium]|nr:hypothetical protein [Alphaproteobacteria bacterium]
MYEATWAKNWIKNVDGFVEHHITGIGEPKTIFQESAKLQGETLFIAPAGKLQKGINLVGDVVSMGNQTVKRVWSSLAWTAEMLTPVTFYDGKLLNGTAKIGSALGINYAAGAVFSGGIDAYMRRQETQVLNDSARLGNWKKYTTAISTFKDGTASAQTIKELQEAYKLSDAELKEGVILGGAKIDAALLIGAGITPPQLAMFKAYSDGVRSTASDKFKNDAENILKKMKNNIEAVSESAKKVFGQSKLTSDEMMAEAATMQTKVNDMNVQMRQFHLLLAKAAGKTDTGYHAYPLAEWAARPTP